LLELLIAIKTFAALSSMFYIFILIVFGDDI